jgi:hypothetical protein
MPAGRNLDPDRVGAQKFARRGKLMISQSVFASDHHLSKTGWGPLAGFWPRRPERSRKSEP